MPGIALGLSAGTKKGLTRMEKAMARMHTDGDRYAYTVRNALGVGFVEQIYKNTLVHELRGAGLAVQQQQGLDTVRNAWDRQ